MIKEYQSVIISDFKERLFQNYIFQLTGVLPSLAVKLQGNDREKYILIFPYRNIVDFFINKMYNKQR